MVVDWMALLIVTNTHNLGFSDQLKKDNRL